MGQKTEHERLLQGAVNLVLMLEKMYKTDIKNTADYVYLYDKWSGEGKPMPETKNVALRASKVPKKGIVDKVWDPLSRWDKKKNPIKWSDQ